MNRIWQPVQAALVDTKGVTALEYGVIAAATIVVGLAVFGTIGTSLASIFGKISTSLSAAAG